MRPYRSLLFVPAHKDTWVAKALAAGPDAIILDLEDAVPDAEKPRAREVLADSIAEARRTDAGVGILVRPNSWESRAFAPDLEAAVVSGLDGLLLPKLYGEADVLRFDAVLTYLELQAGIAEGAVELIATLETAESLDACERIARAPRVVSMLGATARDADVQRAVGYRWTAEGLETLYLRSRVVLACRAAGLSHPVCGLWQDLSDLDGLARFAAANRDLGYRGQVLIHPSHVERVNEVFTPTQEEVAFYRGMIRAFEEAEAAGSAAVGYEGQHVDRAHYLTARETVAFAEGLA